MSEPNLRKTDGEKAAAVVTLILAMDTGGRAALRRGTMGAAFWRLWTAAGLQDMRGQRAARWERFIFAMANFIGTRSAETGQIIARERLGQAIARAGVSELRFEKLITAPIESRMDQADRLIKRLTSNVGAINIYDLADLYLNDEPYRLRAISLAFYSNLETQE